MHYCENCDLVEGKTKENEFGEIVCTECGVPVTIIPEHDDSYLER